jgi:hypothetical protein
MILTVKGALLADTWVWWQTAISAIFGAVFGFLGAYVNKWLEERRTEPKARLAKAREAVEKTAPDVLNRLDELHARDLREAVIESSDLMKTSVAAAFRNATDDLKGIARDLNREHWLRLNQAGWTLMKTEFAWTNAHHQIVLKPQWDAIRRKAAGVGWVGNEAETAADEPDETTKFLVEMARKEQDRAALSALRDELHQLRVEVTDVVRLAAELQRRPTE